MGTRSTIQINSKEHELTIVLYRHWDGNPSSNLSSFLIAIKNSDNFEGFIDEFIKDYDSSRSLNDLTDYSGAYQSELYNTHQGDLEYCYNIDYDNKKIDVYGGGYGDQDYLSQGGKFNVMHEVERYYDEYKQRYKEELIKLLTELTELNWGVNHD
jgi:hypothetical protein